MEQEFIFSARDIHYQLILEGQDRKESIKVANDQVLAKARTWDKDNREREVKGRLIEWKGGFLSISILAV